MGVNDIRKIRFRSVLSCAFLLAPLTWMFSGCSRQLSSTDVMKRYGNAVVLIESVVNGAEIGLGSGFLINKNGTIITNYHVIEDAEEVWIKTKKGKYSRIYR